MGKASREERIIYATQLIYNNPQLGRRQLQIMLKEKYGAGLRSSYINELQKSILSKGKPIEYEAREAPPSFNSQQKRQFGRFNKAGFSRAEAEELARISPDTPYLQDMLADRRRMFNRAKMFGAGRKEWARWLRLSYSTRINPEKEKATVSRIRDIGLSRSWRQAVYALLRYYRDATKDKYPDYQSPGKKKTSKVRAFSPSQAAQYQGDKYPKGRHYKGKRE
jgi:hypothetical protein